MLPVVGFTSVGVWDSEVWEFDYPINYQGFLVEIADSFGVKEISDDDF